MHRFAPLTLTLALAACATAAPGPAPTPTRFDPAPLDASWDDAVRQLNYQGAALILDDSGVLWQRQNGTVDCTPQGRSISPHDLFDMGSVTKVFTATLILRLIERGEITLETRLADLLPSVPADKADIRVGHLLNHTAGLREASSQYDEVYMSRDEVLAQEFALPLLFAPGEQEEYSNVGYSVLAAYLEARFDRPYEEILRRELLEPLNLNSIGYTRRPRRGADVCGWWEGRENPRYGSVRDYFGPTEPSWHLAGNGGLLSTPEDLARFFHLLVTGRVLGPDGTAIVQQTLAQHWQSRDMYIVSGSNFVFTTFVGHYRDTGQTFIMMSNDFRAPKEQAMFFFVQGLNATMDAEAPRS